MIHCPGCDAPIEPQLLVCDLCWEQLPDGLKLEHAAVLLSGGDLADIHDRIRTYISRRIPA